ncbi:MAG: zf-HC2 domain-containing protein [Syntrophaceae bacterium]|nr:zf-HC2 domain-containing protein [Syntrophaceae bacterium]
MKDSCLSISELLEKYFDQEVTEGEKHLVENHLQNCPSCRDTLTSLEGLKSLIKAPVEKAAQEEDFPWVWQKIKREIQPQEKQGRWPSLRFWLVPSPLLKKKVWVPAVATAVLLMALTTQVIFKKTPSYSDASVVKYVESQTHHIMVYESENAKMTMIWLFDEGDQESSKS